MNLVIFLTITVLLFFLKPYIKKSIAWFFSRFSEIPSVLSSKVYRVFIRTFVGNWYVYLVLILIWFLLFKSDVGKDMLDSYLSKMQTSPSLSVFGSFVSLFFCILILSLSIWTLPFFMFSKKTKEKILNSENYKKFYLMTKILAFIAMLPFLLVCNAFLFYSLPVDSGIVKIFLYNTLSIWTFLVVVYLLSFTIKIRFTSRILKGKIFDTYLFILIKIVITVIILSLLFVKIKSLISRDNDFVYLSPLVAGFIFISGLIVFRFLFYSVEPGESNISMLVQKMLSNENKRDSRIFYSFIFWVSAGIVLYYYLVPSLVAINSLYILLVVFGFYIIYLDYWRHAFVNKRGFWRILAFFASVIFLILPFIYSARQFTVPFLAAGKEYPANTSLEFQLKERYKNIRHLDSNSNVFIVCAMGGGSRAGYITASVLKTLDSIYPWFFNHTICYSSVSGGSVGIYTYLKGKETGKISDSSFLRNIYQANYNSSGLFGLLIGDALETMFGTIITTMKDRTSPKSSATGFYDRNYRIRQEYDYKLQDAVSSNPSDRCDSLTFYPCRTENTFRPDTFRAFYLKHQANYPIHLINTFEVNSGRRAIISPFPAQYLTFFPNTILPLQDTSYDCSITQKDIYYRDAVNLSELFPLVSAASHIGNKRDAQFVDGGYYENYGLTTGLDVFRYLRDSLHIPFKNLKLILIKNSLQVPVESGHQQQFFAPLAGAMNAPFTGHANNLLAQAKRDLFDTSHIFVIEFDGEKMKVPLTRGLTKKHIDVMERFSDSLLRDEAYKKSIIKFMKN